MGADGPLYPLAIFLIQDAQSFQMVFTSLVFSGPKFSYCFAVFFLFTILQISVLSFEEITQKFFQISQKFFQKLVKVKKNFVEFACLAIFLHIWILQKIVIKQLKNVINIGALRLASVLSFFNWIFLNCLTNSWNPDPVPHPHPSTSCLITKQAVVHWYHTNGQRYIW